MIVGGIIVHDHMQCFVLRGLRFDRLREREKFLVPMTFLALAVDFTGENVQSRKQRACTMTLVIMCQGTARPGFMGSPGWVRSSA